MRRKFLARFIVIIDDSSNENLDVSSRKRREN